MSLKNQIIEECMTLLKRQDIQGEIKDALKPFFGIIFSEFYPYIFLCLVLIIICFILLVFILIVLITIMKRVKKDT